jgi:two-component system phosphate regulon sensor histidine kinase PhoR
VKAQVRSALGSLRLRLALGYVVVVALVAGAWAVSLYGPLTSSIVEQQRSHLESIARAGALALERGDVDAAATARQLVSGTTLRATVVDSAGVVLADTSEDPARMANHSGRPEIAAALSGTTGYATRVSATTGTEQMYVAVPARYAGGPAALRVSEPVAAIARIAAAARGTGLALLVVAMVAAVAAGLALSRSTARPVLRLKQAAEAMAGGDLRTPVPEAPGELAGLASALGTLRDQIRGRLDDLERGQATLRTVLDGLQDTVLLFDGETISVANAAASRMFRPPPGGWTGARLASAGLPASLTREVARGLASREPLATDVGPDPEHRFFRVSVLPLGSEAAVTRTLVAVSDVTESRRLDRVRRDFVANASHELKTPTAAIQLIADAATSAAEHGDTTNAIAFAAQMREEAGRLRRLVLDLLDLSRLENAPDPGTITDVRAGIGNAMAAHRPAAGAAGLTLDLEDTLVDGVDVYAAVEPTDLAVALDNLLANAIAYTENGGVTVTLDADPTTVTIRVLDTGVGIDAEHLPRVFERFYRVDAARSRDSGGTGLGLALVKHVAERAGGEVLIASVPGSGTTATLLLPRAV